MDVLIREMREADVAPAAAVWAEAWRALEERLGSAGRQAPPSTERSVVRYRHFLRTDPAGAFVAEGAGGIVGLAVSHRRGTRFMLANLAVVPGLQERGIGARLLAQACAYAGGSRHQLICSSPDPRAMSRYVRAGFALSPAVEALGRRGSGGGAAVTVRPSDGGPADRALVDELDREVRGDTRPADIDFLLASGAELWIDDAGGYALAGPSDVTILCAAEPAIARRMLVALLSGGADGVVRSASWLHAGTQWAIEAAVASGAELRGYGAVMTRGGAGYGGAYLLSGVFG